LREDYEAALTLDKFGGTNHAAAILKEMQAVELDDAQSELLMAFYDARRECEPDRRIALATLQAVTATISYEQDLAINVLKRLDDHLMKLINDKRQRELDAIKRGKK
jgi:hypothetical protein